MKTIIVTVLIILCVTGVFAQNSGDGSGVITGVSGTVELKASGAAGYAAARAGDRVSQDTVVSTGFKSTALITVGSSVITVRPLTRLTLREISASSGTETINVSLQTGRVKVDVNPPAGTRASMSIQSPIATASVRGTSFEFDTQSLTVLEGTVSFYGTSGGAMVVSAGNTSEIMDSGRVVDPIDTTVSELLPSPLAGTNSGFRQTKMPDIRGERIFELDMPY